MEMFSIVSFCAAVMAVRSNHVSLHREISAALSNTSWKNCGERAYLCFIFELSEEAIRRGDACAFQRNVCPQQVRRRTINSHRRGDREARQEIHRAKRK